MKSLLPGLAIVLAGILTSPVGSTAVGQVIRAKVEVVNVLCTIKDKKGNYITDLNKDDFEILEEGVPQSLDYFTFESGDEAQPLSVALLVDTSSSVLDKLSFEKQAATEFLKGTLREKKDIAAVLQFDSEINLVQDFTFDLDTLSRKIYAIRAGGGTKLYDAIYLAVEDVLKHQVGRRVMVILSDGKDTSSMTTEDEAARVAQDSDVVIFGIGVQSRGFRSDFGALNDLSKSTGGVFFKSNVSLEKIREAFMRINGEIKNQYSLAYVSTNRHRVPGFRKIEIKLKKRGLKVTHRKGYFVGGPADAVGGGSR